jgi:hypothetical protein
MDHADTQDNSSRAGLCAPNFIRPGEQNFIKRQDDLHVALSEEDDPDNAVDYDPDSTEEEDSSDDAHAAPNEASSRKQEACSQENSSALATHAPPKRAVLDHSDIVRLTTDKHYKFINSLGNHEPQPAGLERKIYNFDEELDDYTSLGGTVRMTKGVASVVFIALAAEAPNTLALKARQEAYEQITRQLGRSAS